MATLTYEAYLDEDATLLTELYDLDDATAIKLVVDAQAAEYFSPHDDHPAMRTLTRAREDAVALYKAGQPAPKPRPKPAAKLATKPQAGPRKKPR
jgi:hypothetical protein